MAEGEEEGDLELTPPQSPSEEEAGTTKAETAGSSSMNDDKTWKKKNDDSKITLPLLLTSRNQDDDGLIVEEDCLLTTAARGSLSSNVRDHHHPLEQEEDAASTSSRMHEESLSLSLSWPLRILFWLNGLTLALPTTALLYIINTRVALSLALLPTYGAVSFLPWSLKPLYALALTTGGHTKHDGLSSFCCCLPSQRHVLISLLLMSSAITTVATAWIPSSGNAGAVLWLFLLGFLRGITGAWPEFLLGLALLQQATDASSTTSNAMRHSSYEECVARFQAQAATARNLGSFLAHILASSLFLYWRRTSMHHTDGSISSDADILNDSTVMVLFSLSGFFILLAAVIAFVYRVGSTPTTITAKRRRQRRQVMSSASFSSSSSSSLYQSCHGGENNNGPTSCTPTTMTTSRTRSSNNSIRVVLLLQLTAILMTLRQPIIDGTHTVWVWNILILSCCIGLAFSVRVAAMSVMTNDATTTNTASHLGTSNNAQQQEEEQQQHCRKQQHLVGLFLILRHVLPDATFLMSSFVYDIFGTTAPILLQFMSLFDMAITTLASWSYGVLFATRTATTMTNDETPTQNPSGPTSASSSSITATFKRLVMSLAVLASVASLANLVIVYMWQSTSFNDSNDVEKINDIDSLELESTSTITRHWWMAVTVTFLCKALMTWTGEWNFLPDIILASVSVSRQNQQTHTASVPNSQGDDDDTQEGTTPSVLPVMGHDGDQQETEAHTAPLQATPAHDNGNVDVFLDEYDENDDAMAGLNDELQAQKQQEKIGIEYGSLISCIDFGDQLGALVIGWIVAAMNITRDNDWHHLDHLIILSAVSMAVGTVCLVHVLL